MKLFLRVLSVLIMVALPAFIIMTSIRLLLTPLTLQAEYHLLKVPPDPFGLSTEERIRWSKVSLDYLLNDQDISFLSEKNLDDGTPLFNERELGHMVDVKNLIKYMLVVWIVVGAILVGFRFLYGALKRSDIFWTAISMGGWLTVGLVAVILAGILLNFDALFTDFHLLFFSGDTWLFYTSDNLIRMFPMEFWVNIFIALGVLMLAFGLLFGFVGKTYLKKVTTLTEKEQRPD